MDLRIAAGESIALLYELARIKDKEFEGEDLDELIAQLKVKEMIYGFGVWLIHSPLMLWEKE